MKAEAWIFISTSVFLALVAPAYWFLSTDRNGHHDWTGTTALVMTFLLTSMISVYLGFHAKKMDARPEDRKDAEIADGAGELGFFPPYSWWPFWCGITLALATYGIGIHAWWLFIIGITFGAIALCGFVFEYYRGEHAH